MKWFLRALAAIFGIFVIALIFMRVPDTDPDAMPNMARRRRNL